VANYKELNKAFAVLIFRAWNGTQCS